MESNAIASVRPSVCPSVRPFVFILSSEPTDRWRGTFAREWVTTIARRELEVKVKLKVMGQANAVGPTSI